MNALAGIALSVVLAAGSPAESDSANSQRTANSPQTANSPRSVQALRQAVDGLVAKEAAAGNSRERAKALREMAALSQEIAGHPTLGKHTAGSLRDRLAGRLKKAVAEIKANAKAAPADAKPATIGPLPLDATVLGQRGAFPFDAPANDIDGAAALAELFEDTVAPESWEKAGGPGVIRVFPGEAVGGLLGQVGGGGNLGGPNFGGGPAPLALDNDQSEELIELIQEVIAPDSWDVVGGAGAAKFFKNKNALVVRQTDEVQEGLFDVVNQLRQN
jgi:hypothetical protein